MKITMRHLNTKRHTLGYKVGGRWRSRKEAVDLARQGKVEDVMVCRGEYGHYIQAMPGTTPLYELPEKVTA